ncbi:hypothetical protein M8C21_022557, partial [Ambrosia artemisiifolia]
ICYCSHSANQPQTKPYGLRSQQPVSPPPSSTISHASPPPCALAPVELDMVKIHAHKG